MAYKSQLIGKQQTGVQVWMSYTGFCFDSVFYHLNEEEEGKEKMSWLNQPQSAYSKMG